MPLIATRGAASAQGFGEFAQSAAPVYIEDVFSTYLYTGNGTTQTITNGIDLSTKGGLVWCKNRAANTFGSEAHEWYDTVRGVGSAIFSDNTSGQQNYGSSRGVTAFSTTGFTVTNSSSLIGPNANGITEVGWTFREQPKFFDVVTYTGTGSNRTVAHNLGSVPGCIIIKNTSASGQNWRVWHRSLDTTTGDQALSLNLASSVGGGSGSYWNYTNPTSTVFTVGTDDSVNGSGRTYVAYLFAHNAGGFGLTGSDNVISCGSATCSGGIATINLGYEPQWILAKQTNTTGDWRMIDNMRGWTNNSGGNQTGLQANTTAAETIYGWGDTLSPTGCNLYGGASDTFIYIAIRRGPMKTPTSGTSVLSLQTYTGDDSTRTLTTGFPVDLAIGSSLSSSAGNSATFSDRLRGTNRYMNTASSGSEVVGGNSLTGFDIQTGVGVNGPNNYVYNFGSIPYVLPALRRAPGFFDTVCYTGTGANTSFSHNLTVAPEMMVFKRRSGAGSWLTYHKDVGNDYSLSIESTAAKSYSPTTFLNSTSPTASVFTVGIATSINFSGSTYVAYLFATCAGVSKVGSYTGTGATQTVNCGFTGGARFVLIKRTDDVGDWFFWDTARGMVSGTDPYLLWNANGNQVTGTNYVFTTSVGFQIQSSAPVGINASGGSYIYLAIA